MVAPAIQVALDKLPDDMLRRSGSVFYTGRSMFAQQGDLYILGLNPGGCPSVQAKNTIERNVEAWRDEPNDHWSAYTDESWEGRPKGAHGMQPRMIHMFSKLGLNPRNVPAANVVFVRSKDEAALEKEKDELLRASWPVHEAVLGSLGVRCVLALGTTAGRWVRQKLGAHELIAEFYEDNDRRWKSAAHRAADGRIVVTVTHPGRADWRNPAADPSGLVRNALDVALSS
ncbi:MAG: hypothetical protein EOO77_01645 [Oxalobacteraceae bacterium]|nr:MAG: hypothetical protein EOO77_01645 [Oxalobacteraceae bacterium]